MSPTSYQLLHPASLVGGIGFEPMKAKPADLQSAPFNHSGIRPHGAGNRTRTYDLLITNQLLYQLSYASTSVTRVIIHTGHLIVKSFHGSFLSLTPTDYSTHRRRRINPPPAAAVHHFHSRGSQAFPFQNEILFTPFLLCGLPVPSAR